MSSALFSSLEQDRVEELIENGGFELSALNKETVILSPECNTNKMGIFLSGKGEVFRVKPDGGTVLLNTLSSGECFGIISVMCPETPLTTYVRTKSKSTVIFFSRQELNNLIEKEAQIARNLIEFMANRIAFLNEKIATFSSDTVT